MTCTQEGIVLRHADYSEGNRMLTLLTPNGLLSCAVRGCKKSSSRMLSCTELFTQGEYVLSEHDGRYTVTSWQGRESFYKIRLEYEKLVHGVYWLNLCENCAQPGEDTSRLFKMLLYSLTMLAYSDEPPLALTCAFLMQLCRLQGVSPVIDRCVRCGNMLVPPVLYVNGEGGMCCMECGQGGIMAGEAEFEFLTRLQCRGAYYLAGREKLNCPEEPAVRQCLNILRTHTELALEKEISSGKLL